MSTYLVASCLLLVLSSMQPGEAEGYLEPLVMPQFMSPQRPGNENFPPNTVVAPVAANVGLQYQPWSGSDADDLEYPTVNVHYNFEPKDWNKKRDELRDRIAFHREKNKFLANADQDQVDLQDVIEGQNAQLQGKECSCWGRRQENPRGCQNRNGLQHWEQALWKASNPV
ncbi:UNVERIFIED_CONTAM: hypothetical protein HHA_217490 [Hammondia hammondi]|eukprot:XP_008889298.1 hypothetical protein HHA_217490 [Hammondia hammondi]